MKPYWTSDDGAIVVYHARCEDVIASVLPVREVALVHADPVYGIGDHAAVAMGLRVIACDVERWCCDTAIGRLGAVTPERAAQPVGPLLGGGS